MPFDWIVYVCVLIASTVVSALLTPRPKDVAASALGEFTVPTAEEGRPVPIVLGTCKLQGPNVTWYGDLGVGDLTRKAGLFKTSVVGHFYSLGIQMALCVGPVDSLEWIEVGDKSLKDLQAYDWILDKSLHSVNHWDVFPAPYAAEGTDIVLTPMTRDLFGGDESEGGLLGTLRFYYGSPTQVADPYLVEKFGGAAPGWRGVCYAVLKSMYLGTSPYLKNWAFIVKSCPCPAGLDPAKREMAGDANPAYGLAYLLTLPRELGGLGDGIDTLDLATFQAAANTLFTEGFGISILLDHAQSADSWMAEILHHINGVIYTDPATGLTCLKLIRADYDPATLPEFTASDWQEAPEITISAKPDTLNRVTVRYLDRAQNFTTRTAQAQDVGNYWARGEGADTVLDFMALSNPALAQMVASREMLLLSAEMAKGSGILNRKGWALRPGSAFKLTFPDLGIANMICRVTNIRYGTLGAGRISVDFAQDVFSITNTAHTAPDPSGWVDPFTAPLPCPAQGLLEAPYWMVGESRQVLALGSRADGITIGAEIWTDEGAGYLQTGYLSPMMPTGLLTSAYSCKASPLDSAGFTVSGGSDLAALVALSTNADGRARGANLAYFPGTGEIISWTTATDNGNGTFTVAGNLRGVLDTVPGDHALSARVWFITGGAITTQSGGGSGSGTPGVPGANGRGYTWRGEWSAVQAYAIDDTVGRNGSSYVAIQPSTGKDPSTETTYWGLMARKGADGSAGGGSGLTYVEVMAETFADLTAFTVSGGTWVAANNAVTQSNGSNASMFLRWNTPVHVDDGAVFEVEIRLPAVPSADARAGITLSDANSTPGGALDMCLHCSGTTTKIAAINNNIGWYFDDAYSYGLNVWVKLRVVRRAGKYLYYINGTLATTKAFTSNAWSPTHVNLWTYGTTAEFRNMKVWNIPEPVLPA